MTSASDPGFDPTPWLRRAALAGLAAITIAACSRGSSVDAQSDGTNDNELSGCHGQASSTIPASGVYGLTTFGGPSEPQPLACGGNSNSGNWYYAASSQRYGCGTHLKVEANGKCFVAQDADYGPDTCVEAAAVVGRSSTRRRSSGARSSARTTSAGATA